MLDTISMTKETALKDFMPLPRPVLGLRISSTAKLLYALLLDRATLSQKNGYQNKQGYTYVIFPVRELAKALSRSEETVRRGLNELELEGLVDRLRGYLGYNQLYVSIPAPNSAWNREHRTFPTKKGASSPQFCGRDPTGMGKPPLRSGGTITNR